MTMIDISNQVTDGEFKEHPEMQTALQRPLVHPAGSSYTHGEAPGMVMSDA
jgi:hypothetical protein